MTETLFCIAALILGPIVCHLSRARRTAYAFFDGFVLVSVGGIVLLEILPRSLEGLGLAAIPLALVGFLFPHAVEHRLGSLPVSPRTILSTLIILGLVLHQLLDGAVLGTPPMLGGLPDHNHHGDAPLSALALAVVLHQLPKGFLLWEIARKAGGLLAAVLVILGLIAATVVGSILGQQLLAELGGAGLLCFHTFIAGGLLHVVVHHVSGGADDRPGTWVPFASGLGALVALLGFALIPDAELLAHAGQKTLRFRHAFITLFASSSPPILVGFLAAGLLQGFVAQRALRFLQGGGSFLQALKGILFGLPLPICSCGVTPVYHTLILRGAPAASSLAFLIATPEIGLDSFFLSMGLLGAGVTFIRLGMAFCIALLVACLLGKIYSHPLSRAAPAENLALDLPTRVSIPQRLRRSLLVGWGSLVDHLGAWLLAGILVAAILDPYLDRGLLASIPVGYDVVLLSLVGLPIYVCASSATPLAAVLLSKGLSTGAVLAFLITGPATNLTTIGVLSKLHGLRRALLLPLTVLLLSICFGLAVNYWIEPHSTAAVATKLEEGVPLSDIELYGAALLGVLLSVSILRLGPRRFLGHMRSEEALGLGGQREEGPSQEHPHAHTHSHARK